LVVFDIDGEDVIAAGEIATTEVPGLPDGLACDATGDVWVAFYQGSCIARFHSNGGLAEVIEMPSPKPLSLCFAGSELVVVTGRSQSGAPDTGAIYRVPVAITGAPVHLAAV
jgi:D-xylonolactonase